MRTGSAPLTAGLGMTFLTGSGFGFASADTLAAFFAAVLADTGFATGFVAGTGAGASALAGGIFRTGLGSTLAARGGACFVVTLPLVLAAEALGLRADLATAFFAGLATFLTGTLGLAAFAAGFFGAGLAAAFFARTTGCLPAIFFLTGVAGRIALVADALAFGFATRGSSDGFANRCEQLSLNPWAKPVEYCCV